MTVNIENSSVAGKACLPEAGAGTADRPMAANAGSTPAPLHHSQTERKPIDKAFEERWIEVMGDKAMYFSPADKTLAAIFHAKGWLDGATDFAHRTSPEAQR